MARKVFYSFHYKPDCTRAAKIRNIGVVEGNIPASDNDWEEISGRGDTAISNWINAQLQGKTCTIVLIGSSTAGRKWINYEIRESWKKSKGLLGIYIHNLSNLAGEQVDQGSNPFDKFTIGEDKKPFSSVIKTYNPPYSTSKNVYSYISDNLQEWIEDAIAIRDSYK